jgi:hypothetical protein
MAIRAHRFGRGTAVALTSAFPSFPTAGLAVSATTVYFGSGPPFGMGGVSEVSVQGGPTSVLVSTSQSSGPVAVDGSRAYWADAQAVYSVPLSGGAATTLAIGQINVVAIAVDAAALYWLVNGNGGPGSVMTLPLAALGNR